MSEAEMSSGEVGSSNTAELGLIEKSVDTLERSILRLSEAHDSGDPASFEDMLGVENTVKKLERQILRLSQDFGVSFSSLLGSDYGPSSPGKTVRFQSSRKQSKSENEQATCFARKQVDPGERRMLSYDVHEKSITRKLNLESPARFSITKNQDEEHHWIASDLFRKRLRQDSQTKMAHKHATFCNDLRVRYRVPALYCMDPPDPETGAVPAEIDPRYARTETLVAWLQDNHVHKKHDWKPLQSTSSRTACWSSSILARRSTADIWISRLAADAGTKAPSDYLLTGCRLPPRRTTMARRSCIEPEQSEELNLSRHRVIVGVPSPRRFGGVGSEICSPRQARFPSNKAQSLTERRRSGSPSELRITDTSSDCYLTATSPTVVAGKYFKPTKRTDLHAITNFTWGDSWDNSKLECKISSVSAL